MFANYLALIFSTESNLQCALNDFAAACIIRMITLKNSTLTSDQCSLKVSGVLLKH